MRYGQVMSRDATPVPFNLVTADFAVPGHAPASSTRRHALPAPHDRRRVARSTAGGRHFLEVDPEALTLLTREAMRDIAHLLRPGPPRAAAGDPRRSRGVAQRPLRRARAAEERVHRGGRRAAVVPGHRHRDRDGQEGRARAHRRRRRERDRARHLRHLRRRRTCATRRWRRSTCTTRRTPAPTCRPRSRSTRSTATSTSSCSWPRAAARRTRASCSRRRRRC